MVHKRFSSPLHVLGSFQLSLAYVGFNNSVSFSVCAVNVQKNWDFNQISALYVGSQLRNFSRLKLMKVIYNKFISLFFCFFLKDVYISLYLLPSDRLLSFLLSSLILMWTLQLKLQIVQKIQWENPTKQVAAIWVARNTQTPDVFSACKGEFVYIVDKIVKLDSEFI